jgi:tripartite-type tricarboxylate transporter receptor subunit TctC
MLITRCVACLCAIGPLVLSANSVFGQDYPNKPVRIVTGSPGSAAEFPVRVIAPVLTNAMGQPFIVDNRPSGVIPGDTVAKSKPDGYTLLMYGGTFWIGPLMEKTPYDPVADFSPVTMVVRSPAVLVTHPSLPVKSVRGLIALARARPGELNYASSAFGASTHLAMELFNSMARVNIVRIPYKGGGAALNALLAGEVQLTFNTGASVTPQLKAGRLKGLAITTAQPSPLFPGLPTVAATLPGYEASATYAMFAPVKTPAAIIGRLHQEVVRAINTTDIKEKLLEVGLEIVGSTPEELAAVMKSEMARLGKVIRDAGISNN